MKIVIAGLDPAIHQPSRRWMRGSSPRMTTFFLAIILALPLSFIMPSHLGSAEWSALKPVWNETTWPFGRDAWAAGRAFRCMGRACSTGVAFYVRPKIGFCNCATGVADDDELERVADLYLLSDNYRPEGQGAATAIGKLKGRQKAFTVDLGIDGKRSIVTFALNSGCDVVIAMLVSPFPLSNETARDALGLLGQPRLRDWIEAAMQPPQ